MDKELTKVLRTLTRKNDKEKRSNTLVIVFAIIVSLLLVFLFRSYRRAMRTNRILYRNVQDSLRREEGNAKYKGSRLTDNDKEQLAQRIDAVMQNTDEICNSDFNLDRLAELANSNYKEV